MAATVLKAMPMNRIADAGSRILFLALVLTGGLVRADERDDFFETKIRPVLINSCLRCHGELKSSGELRVDSRDALMKGGESGPAIIPGNPGDSRLIQAIQRHEDVSAMPPERQGASSGSDRSLCHLGQRRRELARRDRPFRGRSSLGLRTDSRLRHSRSPGQEVDRHQHRCLYPRQAGSGWGSTRHRRQQASPDPPSHLRPDGPPSHP